MWNVTAGARDAALLTDMYCVSNMKQEDGQFTLRIATDGWRPQSEDFKCPGPVC